MQVAEYEAAAESATSNILYRWIPDADRIVAHSTSSRFFEDISRNTGMSQSQIKTDLQEKTSILDWLVKNNIRSLQEFGMVMNLYYRNKELLLSSIKKNDKSRILEV